MKNLRTYLDDRDFEYEIIKHTETLKTAQEGAAYFGIEIGQTAPTLIIKCDRGYYALIISGNYGRIDMTLLQEMLGDREIRLAKPKEVEEVTGTPIGCVSLINPELPAIVDRELFRYPFIYGGTGEPQTTLKINPANLEKLNNVIGYIR